MAWEERGNNRYYYRKHRQADGTVVSEYMGYGSIGALFAHTDGVARHERTMARLVLQDFQKEIQRVDQAIEGYRRNMRGVVADALHALGFHRHRGQWRLKRGEGRVMANEVARATRAEIEEYHELMKAAESKRPGPALARLREYAREHPAVFDGCSMLANSTIQEVIDSSSMSEATRIHVRAEVDALRRGLGGDTATTLERLLIDDVCVCWLRMQIFEQLYSANYNTGNGVTFAKAAYLENRLSTTRRRYLQSIESLARVRGLLLRVGIQVNIAQQQIVTR